MKPEDFRAAEELFHHALELSPEARAHFLRDSCDGDEALRAAVSELIAVEAEAESRLQEVIRRKIVEMAARPRLESDGAEGIGALGMDGDPKRIGPYRILGRLGSGGQGIVLLAERDDEAFQKKVAIKQLRNGLETPEQHSRFRRERQILARLEHPAIARVLDGGGAEDGYAEDSAPYVVMEYVEGEPIDAYCIRHDLGVEAILALFCRAAGAVEAAHRQLVIHRDLKPSNLLVTAAGEPKLLDFGISQLLDEDHPSAVDLTITGRRPLTPSYASPEQLRGQPLTTATDIYSLGVLLYRLLTRDAPYRLKRYSAAEIERIVTEQKPEKPSEVAIAAGRNSLGRKLRGDLDTIVLKALRKEPRERYGSVGELVNDIRLHQSGLPVQARDETFRYRFAKFTTRHRVPVVAGTLATLLFALLIGFYSFRLKAERDRATLEAERADQRATESEAVTQMVTELFALADPNTSGGEDVSAQQLLQRGVELTQRMPQDRPAIRGRLLGFLADVYLQLELFGPARSLLDDRIDLYRSQSPGFDREIAATLTSLGKLELDRQHFDDSRDFLEQAHQAWQALGPTRSRERFQTRIYQISLIQANGAPEDWQPLEAELAAIISSLRELVVQEKRLLAADHPKLAETRRLLAEGLNLDGALALTTEDSHRAARRYREALEILEQILGPAHLDMAANWNDLAIALYRLDQPAESLAARQMALAIHRQLLGSSSFRLANGLGNLGTFHLRRNEPSSALDACQEALEITRSLGGAEHPNAPRLLRCTGRAHARLGEREMAKKAYEESVETTRRNVARGNATPWRLSIALCRQGTFALRQGLSATAQRALRECFEIRRRERPKALTTHHAECLSAGSTTPPERAEELIMRCTTTTSSPDNKS